MDEETYWKTLTHRHTLPSVTSPSAVSFSAETKATLLPGPRPEKSVPRPGNTPRPPLTHTEWPIVRDFFGGSGRAAHFWCSENGDGSQVLEAPTDPRVARTDTHEYTLGYRSCYDLAGGFTLNNRSSIIPPLPSLCCFSVQRLIAQINVCVCVYFLGRVIRGSERIFGS